MAKLKVNRKLWSNISKKKREKIASDFNVKIVLDSDAPIAAQEDLLYGMTIREAAMLLAKKDRSELLSRLKQDLKKEKIINKFLKKRYGKLRYVLDISSKKVKKERKYKKEIHLTKDEALLAEKIEKKLIKKIGSVNAESMLYSRTVRETSYRRLMYYKKSKRSLNRGGVNCFWLCCQYYSSWSDVINCVAQCRSNTY
jgi:hypothetical protein